MDVKALSQFIELGIAGIAVIGLMAIIVFFVKTHKEERKEWRNEAGERHRETTAVLKELTTVIRTANDLNRRD